MKLIKSDIKKGFVNTTKFITLMWLLKVKDFWHIHYSYDLDDHTYNHTKYIESSHLYTYLTNYQTFDVKMVRTWLKYCVVMVSNQFTINVPKKHAISFKVTSCNFVEISM